MSSVKTWSTKEEVMKDLAKASGRRMGKLDENYIVVGNAPPPVIPETEDDEMMQQFGHIIRSKGAQFEHVAPDLQGITNMIRMVQESDTESDAGFENPNVVIAISKLNPNVKEFVPKGSSSHSSSDVSNVETDTEEKNEVTNKISVACEAKEDVEELATRLKNSVATKTDSFESKRQNNVAIASLLRLYATNNTKQGTTENDAEPVKLFTPDYFESKTDPAKEVAVSPEPLSKSTSTTPVPKTEPSSTASLSSNDVRSEPIMDARHLSTPVKPILDPAIKKSIEKVNQWMGAEPSPKKAPAVCLGPISFKRREPNSSKSPSTSSDTELKLVAVPETKSFQLNEYRPSDYAADLAKQYMERTKAQKAKKMNSWTDLDIILKEKDEMLRKKKLAQANENGQAFL